MASYRNQCNLHLGYAKRLLEEKTAENDWGGQRRAAMEECALFQCQLAYQCHLADVLDSYHLVVQNKDSAAGCLKQLPRDSVYPELVEMAEKEDSEWAGQLLGHSFIKSSMQSIASSSQPVEAAGALAKLEELVVRHRENLVEC